MGLLAWSASAQNWTVGGRIGSGFQAVGQYVFSNDNYVEARFGAYWANAGDTVPADFSVLYIWNVCNMDLTPSARGLRYVVRSTGGRLSVPESLIGTGDRIPSSTNGHCVISVLRAFIASKERTRGNKKPGAICSGLLLCCRFGVFSVRSFFPLLMKNVFRGAELRGLNT